MRMKGPKYGFLSNMFPCNIPWKGQTYKSSESIYQMEKCAKESDKTAFLWMNGFEAKKKGRKVLLRPDWPEIKVDKMFEILLQKFGDPELMARLQAIDEPIVEDNYWNDRFWGVCRGEGQNMLGQLLEKIKGHTA